MNILMLARGLPFHGIGGMEVVAWDLAKAFAQDGHQITIITTKTEKLKDIKEIDDVNILALDVPENRYSREWWLLSEKIYLRDFSDKVDVVLSVSAAGRHLAKLKKGKRPIFIVQAHGSSWGEFLSKTRQKNLVAFVKSLKNLIGFLQDMEYKKFDALVSVGAAVYDDYKKFPSNILLRNKKIETIKNGVNFNDFKFNQDKRKFIREKFNFYNDNIVLISCSRLNEQKGLVESLNGFIEAYAKNKKLRYIIIGNGPEYNKLKNIIIENNMEKIVFLLGSKSRDDIANYLSCADVFLFASKRNEGLPINVLEACAASLPVLLSKNIAHEDFNPIVINEVSAKNIAEVIYNFSLEFRCEERKEYLSDMYSLSYSAKQYIELFKELMK